MLKKHVRRSQTLSNRHFVFMYAAAYCTSIGLFGIVALLFVASTCFFLSLSLSLSLSHNIYSELHNHTDRYTHFPPPFSAFPPSSVMRQHRILWLLLLASFTLYCCCCCIIYIRCNKSISNKNRDSVSNNHNSYNLITRLQFSHRKYRKILCNIATRSQNNRKFRVILHLKCALSINLGVVNFQ